MKRHAVPGRLTIRDVAKQAGVSIATVSRYLNKSGYVDEKTGRRIADAVCNIDYAPSMAAIGLKTHCSRIVLLTVPDICNPFYSGMAQIVQQELRVRGYAMALYNTNGEEKEEFAALQLGCQMYASGILFASVDAKPSVTMALANSGIHVVGLNSYEECPFDAVHVARVGGTYLAARHLLELGHRNIAFAGGKPNSMIGQSRFSGFALAMREKGVTVFPEYVFEKGFTQADGYEAGQYFQQLAQRPTAVCCANDLLALGVMDALWESGIRIPEDISITGMDDIPYAHMTSPHLTTVTNDSSMFAREGVRLLFERLDKTYEGARRDIEITHNLVVRASTAEPSST